MSNVRYSGSPAMFAGRSAFVTGASSGIGRDLATMFASQGANVALVARRGQLLRDLAVELTEFGVEALPIVCDVTDQSQVNQAVAVACGEFGTVDIVVNNAGVLIPSLFSEASGEDMRRMMDVNFFGAVHVTRAVLPIMQNAGCGNIVNIASIAGRRGGPTLSGYSASKFALIGFTESLRIELFGSGVMASLVVPASVDTEMLDNPEWNARAWAVGDLKIPPEWVSWGVIAAIILGLAEVDVPLGFSTAQKVAALFPDLTGLWLGMGSRFIDLVNDWIAGPRR
jgi:short-subunit dehydrogenase